MWLNIRFLDAGGNLVAERGPYNDSTAILNEGGTRVWKVEHGIDADVAAATGLSEGPSFHFVLNNTIEHDNRIPPRGYNISAFEEIQAAPVGGSYLQEQYWDDASFAIPSGAVTAQVRLNHQTTSKEYIEFLRDANTTNAAGQVAYDLWEQFGKSRPVRMASVVVDLTSDTCTTPIPYGLGKELPSGLRVELSGVNAPSASAGNFAIHAVNGPPNQLGVLFYADLPRSNPHFGGTLLVQSPLRGPVVHFDANGEATIPIAIDPSMVGQDRYYQLLFRNPGGSFNLGQSEGLYVNFCD